MNRCDHCGARRHGWKTRWLIIAPYVLVVLTGSFGFWRLENVSKSDCVGRQNGRIVLRELVIQTAAGNATTDLTAVPGFTDLDIATQAYLRNLSEAINQSGQAGREAFRDEALAKLPPIDC